MSIATPRLAAPRGEVSSTYRALMNQKLKTDIPHITYFYRADGPKPPELITAEARARGQNDPPGTDSPPPADDGGDRRAVELHSEQWQ